MPGAQEQSNLIACHTHPLCHYFPVLFEIVIVIVDEVTKIFHSLFRSLFDQAIMNGINPTAVLQELENQ